MKPTVAILACALLCCFASGIPAKSLAESPKEVKLTTSDQLTIYGDLYETDSSRPLIILVHQGDGNARGEYAPIADRGAHGSSTLVSDRAGGDVSATWSAVLGFLSRSVS
jgi:hypothetical protein